MRRMDPRQISDAFNAKKQQFTADCDKNGLSAATEAFSLAIRDLKASGTDVSVEIFGDASELGFALFDANSIRTPITGILHIGPIHRLFAFAVRQDDEPVLKLALSEFDIRFNGANGVVDEGRVINKVDTLVYDLKNDADALVKFQDEVLRMAARNAVVFEHDVADSFDKPQSLNKPAFRITPKAS